MNKDEELSPLDEMRQIYLGIIRSLNFCKRHATGIQAACAFFTLLVTAIFAWVSIAQWKALKKQTTIQMDGQRAQVFLKQFDASFERVDGIPRISYSFTLSNAGQSLAKDVTIIHGRADEDLKDGYLHGKEIHPDDVSGDTVDFRRDHEQIKDYFVLDEETVEKSNGAPIVGVIVQVAYRDIYGRPYSFGECRFLKYKRIQPSCEFKPSNLTRTRNDDQD